MYIASVPKLSYIQDAYENTYEYIAHCYTHVGLFDWLFLSYSCQ